MWASFRKAKVCLSDPQRQGYKGCKIIKAQQFKVVQEVSLLLAQSSFWLVIIEVEG